MLCILACSLPALAQKRVSGRVVDVSGETVAGANVVEKGTSNGIITDMDGHFTLNVQENAVLRISYVGYVTQEVSVAGRTTLNVTLAEDAQALDEVVVVGYGTRKKASLTGSVSTMNVNDIRSIPVGNLSNALAGRLSGVTVTNTGGGRPGNSANITVRARGTWNNTNPLYVIDGVARDKRAFDMLNSSDIESFSILKDAAAASVYGARAANGVVLITTRKGKEGKPVISYSGSTGVG
jgi:TonB-dependent SusC/RagA subfamily outer membrane receptor